MKFLKPIVTAAFLTALAIPAIAQPLPPGQMIRKHLDEAGSSMVDVLPRVAAHGQVGKKLEILQWKVIKTGATTSAGKHEPTGLIALFDLDPNKDKSSQDARFIVLQPFEGMCPDDVENDERLRSYGVKPHIDVVASAIIQNGKTQIQESRETVNFVRGSVLDRLFCDADH